MMTTRRTQRFKTHSVAEVLEEVKQAVRKKPQDADLRAQLFQLLSLEGDWQRAVDQLKISAQLNPQAQPVALIYVGAINAEQERLEVLSGRSAPAVFGTPPEWLALLAQAFKAETRAEATACRHQALELAPAVSGHLRTHAGAETESIAFEWIADGDSRLGPVLEFFNNGRYGWIPFEHIKQVRFIEAQGLSDIMWVQTEVVLIDGSSHVGLVPVRYPAIDGYDKQTDNLKLGHLTEWVAIDEDSYQGVGQKTLITDEADYGQLELAQITFDVD